MRQIHVFTLISALLFSALASAQGAPKVGRRAAAKYFEDSTPSREVASSSGGDGLLMLHIGGYSSSTSYAWKDSTKRTGVGRATYGLTYLFDQWGGLDVNLRMDFAEFKVDEERATKLSVMPLLTFPKAETKFPLYFGFGAGAGIFFTQLQDESNLSLDYQLILGARWIDFYENLGAFIEFGMKNHIHVLSDGQFNGMPLSVGVMFTF